MEKQNWKDRLNVVYSTNPTFEYEKEDQPEIQMQLPPNKQRLYVGIDKKQRGGKKVTLISGFIGSENEIKELGRLLKLKCGVGGNVKDGDILIQGDFRDRIVQLLTEAGYTAKRSN